MVMGIIPQIGGEVGMNAQAKEGVARPVLSLLPLTSTGSGRLAPGMGGPCASAESGVAPWAWEQPRWAAGRAWWALLLPEGGQRYSAWRELRVRWKSQGLKD